MCRNPNLVSKNHIYKALLLVWQASKKWTVISIIFQVIQAILPLLILYLTKLIVDTLTEKSGQIDFSLILKYIGIFGLVHLLQTVINNYQQLATEAQQQLVADHLSKKVIDKTTQLDISFYENPKFHDVLHLAQSQAMYKPIQILNNLTDLLKNGLLMSSLAALLIFLHWSIGIVLILCAIPVAFVKWHYSKKMFLWQQKRVSLERESRYINRILTSDTYAKELRIFGFAKRLKAKFLQVRLRLYDEKFKINRGKAQSAIWAKGIEIIAMVIVFSFIAWRSFHGEITIGDLVMYFQAFQKGQASIQSLLTSVVSLYSNRLFITHLFELLGLESILQQDPQPLSVDKLARGIEIKDLTFNYPDHNSIVINKANLSLNKGQVIAFVGENGSGKSTMIKLLCRFYDPQQGTILWDKENYKNLDLKELRKRITVIHQDYTKYQLSVHENIRIEQIGTTYTKDELSMTIKAAKQSGAHKFIESLPETYDQKLGRWFKNGQELSGGQWQKLALSRAFYKDADLIILDEPTSSIDPNSEAKMFSTLRDITKDKILILITHRVYNLKIADKIVVFDQGKVVEKGNHHELMALKGKYAEMYNNQMNDSKYNRE